MTDFTIIAILLVLIHLFFDAAKFSRKVEFWVCMTLLMFLSAFHGPTVGNDTPEYIRIFRECQTATFDFGLSRYEIGYLWLNKLLGYVSDNYQILFIVTALFIFYSYGRFIWKYSNNVWLSVFLFFAYGFFSFSVTALRQSLAVAILLFAFDYVVAGKKWKFTALVLLATLFHSTAIFFILSYFCRYVKVSWRSITIFAVIGCVGLALFSTLLRFAFDLFEMYEHYSGGKYFGETRLASILYVIISSLILLFSFRVLSSKKAIATSSPIQIRNNGYFMALVLFGIVFYILSLKVNILDRIALYYNLFSIILLPNAVKKIDFQLRMSTTSLLVLLFYAYTAIILVNRPEWGSLYPYSFCW